LLGGKKIMLGVIFLMVLLCVFSLVVYQSQKPVRLDHIIDGDTLVFSGGKSIKLLGVNVSEGEPQNAALVNEYLSILLMNKNIWLEYEGFGRDQAWVWVGCESKPRFWVFREKGESPAECTKGVLVNEQIVKMGWSKVFVSEEMGTLRYEDRLYMAEENETI
jgi:endonuclease YncB( thermonuclease family)